MNTTLQTSLPTLGILLHTTFSLSIFFLRLVSGGEILVFSTELILTIRYLSTTAFVSPGLPGYSGGPQVLFQLSRECIYEITALYA